MYKLYSTPLSTIEFFFVSASLLVSFRLNMIVFRAGNVRESNSRVRTVTCNKMMSMISAIHPWYLAKEQTGGPPVPGTMPRQVFQGIG